MIIPDDITVTGAEKIIVCGNHRSKTSVEQYNFVKHKITLLHPDIPFFFERRNNKMKIIIQ